MADIKERETFVYGKIICLSPIQSDFQRKMPDLFHVRDFINHRFKLKYMQNKVKNDNYTGIKENNQIL